MGRRLDGTTPQVSSAWKSRTERNSLPSPEPGTTPGESSPRPLGIVLGQGLTTGALWASEHFSRSRVLTILEEDILAQPKLVFWGCLMACRPKQKRLRGHIYFGNTGLKKLQWFLQSRERVQSISQTSPLYLEPPVPSQLVMHWQLGRCR